VRRDVNHFHEDLVTYDSVDHTVLGSKRRRAVALPFATKRFVVEALDHAQTGGAGDADDILPFLIPFENLDGKSLNSAADPAVFIHLPHERNVLYTIWYVKALVGMTFA